MYTYQVIQGSARVTLFMCISVCMYVFLCISVCVYLYVCIHARVCVCTVLVCGCVFVRAWLCTWEKVRCLVTRTHPA